jgi:hypothetical protein
MTLDVIIRKKQGRGEAADGFQDDFLTQRVKKRDFGLDGAAGTEADVREQTAVVIS